MAVNLRDYIPRFCHQLPLPNSVAKLWSGFVARFCQGLSTVLELGSRAFPNRTTHPSMPFSNYLHELRNEMQHSDWTEICMTSWLFKWSWFVIKRRASLDGSLPGYYKPCLAPTMYCVNLGPWSWAHLDWLSRCAPDRMLQLFRQFFHSSLKLTASLLLPHEENLVKTEQSSFVQFRNKVTKPVRAWENRTREQDPTAENCTIPEI